MIVIRLLGGLGNQMFQYAFGTFLETEYKTKVFYDDFYIKDKRMQMNITQRQFELCAYNVDEKFISNSFIGKKIIDLPPIIKRCIISSFIKSPIIELRNEDNLFPIKENLNYYITGFFQDKRYIEKNIQLLRTKFTLKQDYLDKIPSLINDYSNNSISLHVRRGDYINNINNDLFNICSLEYYSTAINNITNKVNNPIFYIFSDDIEWCKEQNIFKGDNFIFVSNGLESWADLYLMSKCSHNIIANSTFSWWSAVLNNNTNKIVIAPKKWFSNQENKHLNLNNWYLL